MSSRPSPLRIRDLVIETGGTRVRVRTYGDGGRTLVWMHGGGFVNGDLDMPESDSVARALAGSDLQVIAVDYRLVRDGVNCYPAASDDVLAVLSWVRRDDPRRPLAVGGASAGANLAAGAVLRLPAERRSGMRVVLAYPTLHATPPALPDPELRAALSLLPDPEEFSPARVREMYERYLGGPVDGAPRGAVPGAASPGQLASFPPTLVLLAEVDELRLSGLAFAEALSSAGRDVQVLEMPGTRHGFLDDPRWTAPAQSAVAGVRRFLATLGASVEAQPTRRNG